MINSASHELAFADVSGPSPWPVWQQKWVGSVSDRDDARVEGRRRKGEPTLVCAVVSYSDWVGLGGGGIRE